MPRSSRGIALLIVVSILSVIAILAVSFLFSMNLETQSSRQFVSTTQARYAAEAGIAHARALLDDDQLGSRTDDVTEAWVTQLAGHDVDVNGDHIVDSRWWPMADTPVETMEQYGVQIANAVFLPIP